MALDFLLVTFPEERAVLADGSNIGWSNRVLLLAPGDYRVSLAGGGTEPAFLDISLSGTTAATPKTIAFGYATAAGSA